MKYLVPSSKIVFTDFMILLVSVLMGLNSVMSFSEGKPEIVLPLVNLPPASNKNNIGTTALNRVFVTIQPGPKGKLYFYNNHEVTLGELVALIRKAKAPAVVVRADRSTTFVWEEFSHLALQLSKAGVKEISYATTTNGGTEP
jgi:biopolymer transport protein ExbD